MKSGGDLTNSADWPIKACSFHSAPSDCWRENEGLVLPEFSELAVFVLFWFLGAAWNKDFFFFSMKSPHLSTLKKQLCHTDVGQTKQVFEPDLSCDYSLGLLL